ncbi:MAG TPA: hypothetical protein DD734_05955 [Firmicutes bacterium]|nr:hypothetical protein [Bacillota bacterium]HBR34156.1 hypothetical protein [Bacillota bacterium]
MLSHNFIREFILSQLLDLAELPVLLSTEGLEIAQQMANKMVDIFQTQKKLYVFGFEPYHHIARDLADNFSHGLNMNRPPLPVVLLEQTSGDPRPIPRLANQGEKGDGLLIITGEQSQATESLIEEAKANSIFTFAFCSYPPVKKHAPDLLFYLPVVNRPRVKELFLMLGHIICTLVESSLFGNSF